MLPVILYIHGMGGGADSRIPSILNDALAGQAEVVVRTYDFNPDIAVPQIRSWVAEVNPALIIGESLGSLHALRIKGIPHLFVSPSLNAPLYFRVLSWLCCIPGVTSLFDRIYKPREGDRQKLHFIPDVLSRYPDHRNAALENSIAAGSDDYFHAFFGTRDHYRKSGIVSVRTWKKYFGETFSIYEGTHFMEEGPIYELLVPMIHKVLDIK